MKADYYSDPQAWTEAEKDERTARRSPSSRLGSSTWQLGAIMDFINVSQNSGPVITEVKPANRDFFRGGFLAPDAGVCTIP
jgi:hypothetical protein